MKTCPNPSCPEKQRGAAPTYRADATVCPKCATPLSSSALPSTSMALPSTASMTPTSTPATPAAQAWRRSAWATLLLVATGLALTWIPLPGVDLEALGVRVDAATVLRGGLAPLSVGALGLAPLLAAFFVVEVAAWAVPALRPWRSAPAGRARLTRAALVLGLGLALVQASMLLRWVTSSSWSGLPVLDDGAAPLVLVSLVGGVAAHVLLVHAIARLGVLNGFSAFALLAAAETLAVAAYTVLTDAAHDRSPALKILIALAVAATVVLARKLLPRSDGEGPAVGLVPLTWALAATTGPAALSPWLSRWVNMNSFANPSGGVALAILFGVAGVAAAALSSTWALHPSARARTEGVGLTLALCAVSVVLGAWEVPAVVVSVVVVVAVVADVVAEARVRGAVDVVCVGSLHQVRDAQRVLRALQEQGIAGFVRGMNHRSLAHFFAPELAMDVFVDVDAEDAARVVVDSNRSGA